LACLPRKKKKVHATARFDASSKQGPLLDLRTRVFPANREYHRRAGNSKVAGDLERGRATGPTRAPAETRRRWIADVRGCRGGASVAHHHRAGGGGGG